MKKNKKETTGIQMLSDIYGLDVTADSTLAFLSIVCCCMREEEVKEFFGFSSWEYDRIFTDAEGDCIKRWHRSPKMAFKTMDAHMEKQDLDDCQYFISFLLWGWIRNEYLMELGEEMEDITGDTIIDNLDDEYDFEVSEKDLDIVGHLMFKHLDEISENHNAINA